MEEVGARVRREMGAHVRRLRVAREYTLDRVAELVGEEGIALSASTISRVERGVTGIPTEAMAALCRVLGSDLAEMGEIIRVALAPETELPESQDPDELHARGRELAVNGRVREALDHFEAAHDVAEESGTRGTKHRADALIWMAACYRRLHCFRMVQEIAGRLLNLPECPHDVRLHAILYHVEVGYITGDAFQAEIHAKAALEMVGSAGDPVRARARTVLGMFRLQQERFADAVSFFESAQEDYRALGNAIEMLRTSVSLGICHFMLGRRDGALRLVAQARRDAEKAGFREVAAYAMRALGRLKAEEGDLESAADHFTSAANLAKQLGLPGHEFLAWYRLWSTLDERDESGRRGRLERRLRRLLGEVMDLPEAREFASYDRLGGSARPGASS